MDKVDDRPSAMLPETANDAFIRKGAFVMLVLMTLLVALAVIGVLYQLVWH